jgi:RNA ligase (TIGR02306 family)
MLASVQKIISVESIPNADRIEKVKVLGWDCIVKKGLFNPGDLCIYIEIDTLIPKYLLTEDKQDTEMIRLKTIKMKGQLSQGLVLPIDYLNKYCILDWRDIVAVEKFIVDVDVTNWLGIKKYEKSIDIELNGNPEGNFPEFITKTDEMRLQSYPEMLQLLKGKPYYITTKIDGTSATFYNKDEIFYACSRNLKIKENPNSAYWNIAYKYRIDEILPEGFCIQGEIAGPRIQQNKLGLKELELFIFNIIGLNSGKRLHLSEQEYFCSYFGLPMVDVIDRGDSFNYTFEKLMEIADNLNYPNGAKAEGIVIRSQDQSISFKVVSNKFLLKNGE